MSPTQPYFNLFCPCKPPNASQTAPIEAFEATVTVTFDHRCLLFPTRKGWHLGYELPMPNRPLVDLWNEVGHGYRRMCMLLPNHFPRNLNYIARLPLYATLVNKSAMLHALGYPSLLPLVASFGASNFTWCKTGDDFGFDFTRDYTIVVPPHLRCLMREMCYERRTGDDFNFTYAAKLNFTPTADKLRRKFLGAGNQYDKPGEFERVYNHHKVAYDVYARSKIASAHSIWPVPTV
jgi:hypothetical protein